MERVSHSLGLTLDREYWHQKLFGHDFCTDSVGTVPALLERINHSQLLPDGKSIELRVEAFRPFPSPEVMVPAQDEGKVLVVVWSGVPYVVQSIDAIDRSVYDASGATAHYTFVIKALNLVDANTGNTTQFTAQSKLEEIDASFYVRRTE